MEILIAVSIFVFGLIIGSFLNVVILRLDTGLGFGGRSQCFSCGKELSWRELVPVFSFLYQKGKCKKCKSKISWQYPAVEFSTAATFLLFYLKMGFEEGVLAFVLSLFLAAVLVVISVFDIRHQQIPNVPLAMFYLSALVLTIVSDYSIFIRVIQGLMLASPLLLLWGASRGRWLGFGDVLLMFGVGLWLGLSVGVGALLMSFWIGALLALVLMFFSKKYSLKTAIPFGPFIVLGSFVAFLYTIDIEALLNFFAWI
jgi:prepilin signal peptidase PulO-like enzyme (type II secretory pathway)